MRLYYEFTEYLSNQSGTDSTTVCQARISCDDSGSRFNYWTTRKAATLEFFYRDNLLDSAGNITVITFDDLPTGNGVLSGNEFSSQGLTIIQRDSLPINVLTGDDIDSGFPNNVNSAPNALSSTFFLGGYNNANSDNFDCLIGNTSFFAGLWIGNIGSGGNNTTEIQFLDSFDKVIASEIISFNAIVTSGERLLPRCC